MTKYYDFAELEPFLMDASYEGIFISSYGIHYGIFLEATTGCHCFLSLHSNHLIIELYVYAQPSTILTASLAFLRYLILKNYDDPSYHQYFYPPNQPSLFTTFIEDKTHSFFDDLFIDSDLHPHVHRFILNHDHDSVYFIDDLPTIHILYPKLNYYTYYSPDQINLAPLIFLPPDKKVMLEDKFHILL